MAANASWANPVVTRSKVVLEIAAGLVDSSSHRQVKVLLRDTAEDRWPVCLHGSSTFEGVHEVVAGLAQLAIINPSAALTLAYRGVAPFESPQPVRTIGVIPSADELVFAVRSQTGLTSFEEIATSKVPLRISTRGMPNHCIHTVLEHVFDAAGFSRHELCAWGGSLRREGGIPTATTSKFKALVSGEIDAIFDEGSDEWLGDALAAGMTILPLSEATLSKLETRGFRRAVIPRVRFPALARDVPTIDFSGWPIFVHADLDGELVSRICAALDTRRHLIPWQGSGPLPVDHMVRNEPSTPMDVPLHPAAEQYWRGKGYLV